MKTYDIDLAVRVRCVARSESEAIDVVLEQFRNGKYNDTSAEGFEVTMVKEVL